VDCDLVKSSVFLIANVVKLIYNIPSFFVLVHLEFICYYTQCNVILLIQVAVPSKACFADVICALGCPVPITPESDYLYGFSRYPLEVEVIPYPRLYTLGAAMDATPHTYTKPFTLCAIQVSVDLSVAVP
jgi:hypothetical protein